MKINNIAIRVADETLTYRDVQLDCPEPTGAQILAAAGVSGPLSLLLQVLPSGDIESIRPGEKPDLSASRDFIIGEGDRSFIFSVDEARLEWPHRYISGAIIRKMAKVSDDRDLLQQDGGENRAVGAHDMVDIGKPGLERFVTTHRTWKLRVQGVTLSFTTPLVKVADAMKEAGFEPNKAWNIFLLVAGEAKKVIDKDYIVDLRTPGIEKIRLMQSNVDNGDCQPLKPRREFALLAVDGVYLNGTGLIWETIICGDRRWLIIHDFPLLAGYIPVTSKLALNIPKDYPNAQIDMFYFAPAVSRRDGVPIDRTQVKAAIEGTQYQGWSRHRNKNGPWDPYTDNVATHLALVEHSLAREFGE